MGKKNNHTLDRLIDKNRQFLPGKVTQPIARMMLPKPQVRRYQDHHHGRWGSGTHAQLQHLTKDNRRFVVLINAVRLGHETW